MQEVVCAEAMAVVMASMAHATTLAVTLPAEADGVVMEARPVALLQAPTAVIVAEALLPQSQVLLCVAEIPTAGVWLTAT